MTAANVLVSGTRRPIGLAPVNTAEATMLTVGPEGAVVVAVYIANLTGSGANATVKWGNGVTDYAIINIEAVAARSHLHLDVLLPLREGYTIKVTSGTNDALAFTLVVVEFGGKFGVAA